MLEEKNEKKMSSKFGAQLMNSLSQISDSESGSELDSEFESKVGSSPADFPITRNKEWWDHLTSQLQEEAERQRISDHKETETEYPKEERALGKDRSKRLSWLESKEKMTQLLDETSFKDYGPLTKGNSSNIYSINESDKSSELSSLSLEGKSWWDHLKESLDKSDGTIPLSHKDETKVSETQSSSFDWWDNLKNSLEKTTSSNEESTMKKEDPKEVPSSSWWGQLTNKLDSESGSYPSSNAITPTTSRGIASRSRSTSMSAFGRPEQDNTGGTILRIFNGIYRGESIISSDSSSVAHGIGTFSASNGEMYVGEWNQGKRHGKGIRTWKDGKLYIGEWENNKRTGNGLMKQVNGDVYIGGTQFGFQQGNGMMTYSNGDKYIGDWNVGEKHGYGVMYFKNGDSYFGEWNRNKRDGYGIFRYSDGKVKEGMWKDNKYMGIKKH